ncbi:MAG TPA: porin family protein [bacterium]|jgi:hypothetical protein|nr:porin family protein [bacterium]
MKKLILTLGCLCLMALGGSLAMADEDKTSTSSDSGSGAPFRLGVEGGFDLANLNGQNVNDVFGSRLGWVAGAFASLPIGPTFAIQPELMYEQKGGKYNGNPYRLDYLEIPVLLDIKVIGPVGILLGPSFDANVANSGVSNLNSTDVGLVAGVQVNLERLLVSGRYELGLTNINSNQQIQNGTFTMLVGLSLL